MATAPTLPPPPPSSPPAPTQMTRAELLALGQAGRAWEFLPIAVRALREHPHDHALRFFTAVNFARLGLRTPALECLDALPEPARSDPAVRALADAAAGLPEDRISPEAREAVLRGNLAALQTAGVPHTASLAAALPAWGAAIGAERWFRALDGNITRLDPAGCWQWLADMRAAPPLDLGAVANDQSAPVIVEGLRSPWALAALLAEGPSSLGVWRRIALFDPAPDGPVAVLDMLAAADLAPSLTRPGLRIFTGTDAGPALAADLAAHAGYRIQGPVIVVQSAGRNGGEGGAHDGGPAAPALLRAALAAQSAEDARLREELAACYASRDDAWWRTRLADGRPLRFLILTTRFSTFMKHAAADLAAALAAAGAEARVVLEPDDSSSITSVAEFRAMAEFDPDLLVLINYSRGQLGTLETGGIIPRHLPVVTWVQDAMPHLFDRASGEAVGPRDLLVGHLYPELFDHFGYPRDESRHLSMPVVASAGKFAPDPAAARDLRPAKFAPDIAYVSHQSEPPEAMHARLIAESAREPQAQRIMAALEPLLRDAVARLMSIDPQVEFPALVRRAHAEVLGAEPSPRVAAQILTRYAVPYAERLVRHQTLAWAAGIARRHGLRFQIHGRGWDRHPTLAPFAAPEVPHDAALAALYARAGVHLHMSVSTLAHQRVMECALAGGFPLCRLTATEADVYRYALSAEAIRRGLRPSLIDPQTGWLGYHTADAPELMRIAALQGRLGLPMQPTLWMKARRVERIADGHGIPPPQRIALWLLGETSANVFRDEAELEARLLAALDTSSPLRSATAALCRKRVLATATTDALAGRLLNMVRRTLGGTSAAPLHEAA